MTCSNSKVLAALYIFNAILSLQLTDEQEKTKRQEADEKHFTGEPTEKKYKFKDAKQTFEEALREEERRERQEKSTWHSNLLVHPNNIIDSWDYDHLSDRYRCCCKCHIVNYYLF